MGWQRREENQTIKTREWWNANICARYTFIPNNSISVRLEHFHDPYQVLLTPVTYASGFRLSSASLGYNLGITGDVLFRLEARYFGSPGQLYPLRDGTTTNKDLWLTAGITARFR